MTSNLVLELNSIFLNSNLFLSKLEFNFLLSKYNYLEKEDIFKTILEYLFKKSKEHLSNNKSYKTLFSFVFERYSNVFYSNIFEEQNTLYFQLFRKAFLNDLILLTFNGEEFLSDLLFDFIKKIDLSAIDKNGLFIFHIIKYDKRNGYKVLKSILENSLPYPNLENNIVFKEELFKIIYTIKIKDYIFLKELFPWLEEEQKKYFDREINTNKYLIILEDYIKKTNV